ncbi:hypothetical protein BD779DRAFT_1680829 [Infundibulicybe gibba]|nr:hypothetical protein BD779DRAFT_1680829 [Infundibulicybe gibba]
MQRPNHPHVSRFDLLGTHELAHPTRLQPKVKPQHGAKPCKQHADVGLFPGFPGEDDAIHTALSYARSVSSASYTFEAWVWALTWAQQRDHPHSALRPPSSYIATPASTSQSARATPTPPRLHDRISPFPRALVVSSPFAPALSIPRRAPGPARSPTTAASYSVRMLPAVLARAQM